MACTNISASNRPAPDTPASTHRLILRNCLANNKHIRIEYLELIVVTDDSSIFGFIDAERKRPGSGIHTKRYVGTRVGCDEREQLINPVFIFNVTHCDRQHSKHTSH